VIWNSQQFKAIYDQVGDDDDRKGLGTHSTRKYSSTEAKRRGGDTDQVEYRGRWVGDKKRSVCATRYIDVDSPYDDAYIAGLLCDEGPVAYELKEGYEVDDEWLFANVVPNIRDRYQNDLRLCRVLALALLWGSFNNETRIAMQLLFARSDRADVELATYLYSSAILATDKRIGQKRSLRASTRRELSFGTNGVLIRRV
jgi:hypothetical protein